MTYSRTGGYPNDVNEADMPSHGRESPISDLVPFVSYESVGSFISRNCDDTFTVRCGNSGSAYSYESNLDADSWFGFEGTISGGESRNFLLYRLTPIGMAAAGVYELFTASLGLNVHGRDAIGTEISADIYSFSTACDSANCTFTRTVSDVPIPAAAWLFGSGLIALAGLKRRKG